MYSAFPGNCNVSYLSFVYGRSLRAELNGGKNSLHWKANAFHLFTFMTLCIQHIYSIFYYYFSLYVSYNHIIWVLIQTLIGIIEVSSSFVSLNGNNFIRKKYFKIYYLLQLRRKSNYFGICIIRKILISSHPFICNDVYVIPGKIQFHRYVIPCRQNTIA